MVTVIHKGEWKGALIQGGRCEESRWLISNCFTEEERVRDENIYSIYSVYLEIRAICRSSGFLVLLWLVLFENGRRTAHGPADRGCFAPHGKDCVCCAWQTDFFVENDSHEMERSDAPRASTTRDLLFLMIFLERYGVGWDPSFQLFFLLFPKTFCGLYQCADVFNMKARHVL